MRALVLLSFAALVASCANRYEPRPPQNDVEHMVFYAERTRGGELHQISGPLVGERSGKVDTVPWDVPVDVNSQIEIRLDKSAVAPPAPDGASDAEAIAAQALAARSERLKTLVQQLAKVVELRQAAQRAWQARVVARQAAPDDAELLERARKEATAAIQSLAASKQPVFKALESLYPDTLENAVRRAEVEAAHDQLFDHKEDGQVRLGTGEPLSALLQAEIDDLDRAMHAAVESARKRGSTHVRLEAFLVAAGEGTEPVAVHLEGYDEIDAREVRVVDRFGLKLSPEERARLESLSASAKEIAEALERVRKGEAELSEAFQEATSDLAVKLGAFVAKAEELKGEWQARASDEQWAKTKQAVEKFVDALAANLAQLAESERENLKEDAEAALASWKNHSKFAANVAKALDLVPQVREAWRASPLDLVAATTRTLELVEALKLVVKSTDDLREIVERARELVDGKIAQWKETLPENLHGALAGAYESSGLKEELDGWRDLIERSRAVLGPVADYVGFVETRPLGASIRSPSAIDVPLDDAPNTAVDLTRTDRMPGDRIEVRASTIEKAANGGQDKTTGSSSASFVVKKLDWHADLVPAVVLATADQLAGDSDSGGFTASLSWMLRYGPRPDEDGALANSARWLGWGIGPHATLLNFDTEEDIEIGLGLTVGFWGDRLLIGAGANPLSDNADDGRFYYFIGSSLIPLLQALE